MGGTFFFLFPQWFNLKTPPKKNMITLLENGMSTVSGGGVGGGGCGYGLWVMVIVKGASDDNKLQYNQPRKVEQLSLLFAGFVGLCKPFTG